MANKRIFAEPLRAILNTKPVQCKGPHSGIFFWPGPGSVTVKIGRYRLFFYPTQTISIAEPLFQQALDVGLHFVRWCAV